MKFKCGKCGRLIYTAKALSECPDCGEGNLDQINIPARERLCPGQGVKVKVIRGVPSCEDFRLVNAVGQRCVRGKAPGPCPASQLPVYNPRVGVGRV